MIKNLSVREAQYHVSEVGFYVTLQHKGKEHLPHLETILNTDDKILLHPKRPYSGGLYNTMLQHVSPEDEDGRYCPVVYITIWCCGNFSQQGYKRPTNSPLHHCKAYPYVPYQ